ncbi:unnamed protein product, partial [Coregonus sp. 'balchen']
MDKDKFAVSHDPCSWLEMHQFIGDLMVSGGSLGLKDAPGSAQPRQTQGECIREARDGDISGQKGQHHTCTCPGCPYSSSSSSSSFQTIKPRGTVSSQPEPSSTYSPELSQPQSQDKETSTQSPNLAPITLTNQGTSSPSPLPQISTFSCFCCHRGFQTCTQLLHHQQGAADSPFSQTHTHYHHHCPLTTCLPHYHSHYGLSPGTFPCLSCQHSFPSCSQLLRHQQGHTHPQNHVVGVTTVSPTLHPCMHCSASFPRPSQLLQHQRTQHAHKAGGFLCTDGRQSLGSSAAVGRPSANPTRIRNNPHTDVSSSITPAPTKILPPGSLLAPPGSGLTVISDKEPQFQSSSVKIPSRRAEPGSSREGRALLYTCEDCGLRFGDAPSRNRHQTLVHYSTEGVEKEGLGDTEGE